MRLVIHVAMKDLRAHRWLVAAWAGVLLATCAFEGLKLDVYVTEPAVGRRPASHLVWVVAALAALSAARAVIGWLLAVRIVHADPVDGTTAFWFTRPLSGRMLLASKLGLIGTLLVLVPGLSAAIVFALNGVPWTALPLLVAARVFSDLVVLLPMILLAALTRDITRIVLALIAGLGLAAVIRTAETIAIPNALWPGSPDVDRLMMWLAIGAAVGVASLTLTCRQYLTRRTASTAIMTAGVVVCAIAAVTVLWTRPRPDRGAVAAAPDHPWAGASRVSLRVPAESITSRSWDRYVGPNAPRRRDQLLGNLEIQGTGDGWVVDSSIVKATLRLAGTGETFSMSDRYWFDSLGGTEGAREIERLVGAQFIESQIRERRNNVGLLELSGEAYERHQGMSGVYEAGIVLQAFRLSPAVVIPLTPGASGRVGWTITTVLSVRRQRDNWIIDVRQSSPIAFRPGRRTAVAYLLRNRKRGEAIRLWDPWYAGSAFGPASSYVNVYRSPLTASARVWKESMNGPGWGVLDPSWFDDVELVLVEVERVGPPFTKHLTIPNFTLPVLYVHPAAPAEKR